MANYNLTKKDLARYKQKYRIHRYNASLRLDRQGNPIQFNLSFDEWMDIWFTSGYVHLMGRSAGSYVMSRNNDIGNYEVGNVSIQPVEQNIREGHKGLSKNRGDHTIRKGVKHDQATKDQMSADRKGRKYQKPNTPIMTPAGQFDCIKEASEYLNITPEAIHYFKRKYPEEWYYITE